jgi:hypothetical protein
MLTENELKHQLRPIVDNDYAVPDEGSAFDLALAMLPHVGSTDPDLRDDLIYMTLAYWIERGILTGEQKRELLSIARNTQHLFYKLGEQGTDSIFTRSFSVLLIAALFYGHRHVPYLTQAELIETRDDVVRYLAAEQDLRGYDPQKGWIHAVAHSADALNELAACLECDAVVLDEILAAIQTAAAREEMVFGYEEDERLATTTMTVFGRKQLSAESMQNWIERFATLRDEEATNDKRVQRYINIKHFLRSLYFRLLKDENSTQLQSTVLKTLDALRR